MTTFEQLSRQRRRAFCDNASEQLELPAASIEKDYWICWTLRQLFRLPSAGPALTFKGGTSLSKGWRLIERFSEDIDIVIDRRGLGFEAATGPEAPRISNKDRERRLEQLRKAAGAHVSGVLLPALAASAAEHIVDGSEWNVVLDPADADQQTILLEYPTELPSDAYVRNAVKVELGARSDTDPTRRVTIRSYLSEALPDAVEETPFEVSAVDPKRTFWEKAMLLHEEAHRTSGKELKGRLSRHYYDLTRLIQHGIADQALEDTELFDAIAAHRRVFFARNKAAHDSMRLGQLRLAPQPERVDDWRKDYERMRESMFFGQPPSFDEILNAVQQFESRANGAKK
jgi:hypothetical protein